MKKLSVFFLLLLSSFATADLKQELDEQLDPLMSKVIAWRHNLHQNPELSNREYKTSKKVATHLRSLGIKVETKIAYTGVVGLIEGGLPGPTIALRADMDALPVEEKTGLPFASKERATYLGQSVGVMHACGHDGHTSMLLGAAKYLSENNDFDGSVYFIFQPGEEGFAGGQKMIQDGMFDDFKIDEVYALHNWPELPIGSIGVNSGPMMAAVDEFDIVVKGRGGHAAIPQLAIDPVVIASQIVLAVQTIVSRSTDPVDKALISITKITN